MKKRLVVVTSDGRVVCEACHLADTPYTRLRGLLGRKHLGPGEGLLLRPTFSIHTAFLQFPIDAVLLDEQMGVIKVAHNMTPWRLTGARRAKAVLELAAGECKRLDVKPGDRLGWGSIQ